MTRKRQPKELTNLNVHFETVKKALTEMAEKTERIMPLTSDILIVARKSVKLYQDSFNAGLKK